MLITVHPFQVCPEDLTSVDSIRAALGVGLVPNLAPSLRQKPEDKTADEKTGSAQPGEDNNNNIISNVYLYCNFNEITNTYNIKFINTHSNWTPKITTKLNKLGDHQRLNTEID